jgi:hypothetical protein
VAPNTVQELPGAPAKEAVIGADVSPARLLKSQRG